MVVALEHDEHIGRGFKIAPLRVGAGEMDFQRAKPRGGRIENERNRIGDEPLGAVADQQPEHALLDQRVQFGQVLVSMERGFVQGGLVAFMWAMSSECEGQVGAKGKGVGGSRADSGPGPGARAHEKEKPTMLMRKIGKQV